MRKRNWEEDDLLEYVPEDEEPVVVSAKAKIWFAALFLLIAVCGGLFIFKDDLFPAPETKTVVQNKTTGDFVSSYSLFAHPEKLLEKDGFVWMTFPTQKILGKFDISQQRIVQKITLPESPHDLTVLKGGIWVTGETKVFRVDIAEGDITKQIDTGNEPSSILATKDTIWVINKGDDTLSQIDSSLGEEKTFAIDPGAFKMVYSENTNFIWIAHGNLEGGVEATPLISKFNIKRGKVTKQFDVADNLEDIVNTENVLWTFHGEQGLGKYSLQSNKQIGNSLINFEGNAKQGKYANGFLYIYSSEPTKKIFVVNKDTANVNQSKSTDANNIEDFWVDKQNVWFVRKGKNLLDRWQKCSQESPCKTKKLVNE